MHLLGADGLRRLGLHHNALARVVLLLGGGVWVAALALTLRTVGAVLALALRAIGREQLTLALATLALTLSRLALATLTLSLSRLALGGLALSLLRQSAAQAPDPGNAQNSGDDVRRWAPLQAMQHIAPFPFLGM